jgi:hypothetical protein
MRVWGKVRVANLLTACVGWRHSAALQLKVRVGAEVRVRVRAQGDWDTSRTIPPHRDL